MVFGEIAQREVLAIGDADVDAELANDCGKPVKLCGSDIAETTVGDSGNSSLCCAANDVGVFPAFKGTSTAKNHRSALTHCCVARRTSGASRSITHFDDFCGNAAWPGR